MAGLILLTLVLLGWQHWGMNRRLDISPQTGYRYSVTDDRPEGDSIAQFFLALHTAVALNAAWAAKPPAVLPAGYPH